MTTGMGKKYVYFEDNVLFPDLLVTYADCYISVKSLSSILKIYAVSWTYISFNKNRKSRASKERNSNRVSVIQCF